MPLQVWVAQGIIAGDGVEIDGDNLNGWIIIKASGSGGTVQSIASAATSITVTDPDGPATNLEVNKAKLPTAGAQTSVLGSGTTDSLAFAVLAGTSAQLLDVPTGTLALVSIRGTMQNDTVGDFAALSFSVSGATVIAASITRAIANQSTAANSEVAAGADFLVTLTAGNNNFFVQGSALVGGTATFSNVQLTVVPLN